jgi:hypothetical protein
MRDEGSLSLQNNMQSAPRRELQIILERAECTFAALKEDLVSVFVFVHAEKKAVNVCFHNHCFWEPFFHYMNFLIHFNLLLIFNLLSHSFWNIL